MLFQAIGAPHFSAASAGGGVVDQNVTVAGFA
jgi:hypothetical protein